MNEIKDLSSAKAEDVTVDVCVIGSGPGGATAAWELAAAGKQVLILEEGGDFIYPSLTLRDGMYDQLYMERGGRSTSDLAITVLQGRALGGGGVINACDVVPLHDGVLRHWQKTYGLTDFSPEALEPYRKLALVDLSANLPTEDQLNANNKLLRAGTAALGWRGEVMMHNRVGCVGLGRCLVGCAADAKRNPRFVAILKALDAGAQVYMRARAVRIEDATGDVKVIRVRTLDAKGYHEERSFVVRAKTVVLAANAVASAQLLLRSGLGNEHVGRNLSLQPQLPITALFERDVRLFRGIPQSYAVTEFEELATETTPLGGFRIEGIGATLGIMSTILPAMGPKGKEQMALLRRMAASLLLVPDGGHGTVTVDAKGRPKIGYAMPDEQKKRFRAAVVAAAKLYLAAGATKVMVPTAVPVEVTSTADLAAIDALTFEPATTPFLSAHQQGTVRFAASASAGGADPSGQVYGTRGVYVLDSSGYPTSSSSHTMTPIITTSRFLARQIASRP